MFAQTRTCPVYSWCLLSLFFATICVMALLYSPGSAYAAHFGYRDISRGCEGEDVANLQWLLGKMGYYSGEINGIFDDGTQEAVKRLQTAFGLEGNGILAGETLELSIQAWAAYQFTEFGYEVKKGDTLSRIAKVWGVPLDAIIKLNNIENPDLILPGQRLHIPVQEFGIHLVKEGETLQGIAEKYKVKLEHLLAWNGLSIRDEVQPRRALIILDVVANDEKSGLCHVRPSAED